MSAPRLPSRTLSATEAADFLAPFLEPGERYMTGGLATSMDMTGRVKSADAGRGHLLLTNARLIHWIAAQGEPWLLLPLSDVDRVQRGSSEGMSDGLAQVIVFAKPPAGRFDFFVPPVLADALVQDFGKGERPSGRDGTQSPPKSPPQGSATGQGPRGSSSTQFKVILPPVSDRDRITSYRASLRAIRVLEPATYLNNMVTVRMVTDTVQRATDHAEVQAEVAHLSDPLMEQLRLRWSDGRLPAFDPDLIHACLAIGVAAARVERDSGWTRKDTLHPALHCALALMGSIGEQEGPGVNVFLDAVFNVARGSATPSDAFAE